MQEFLYLSCNTEIMALVSQHKMVIRWDLFNTVAGWMSAFYVTGLWEREWKEHLGVSEMTGTTKGTS